MDPALKHRLIGAAVLSALAIIFLPMLIVGRDRNDTAASVPLAVPGAPGGNFETKELPLVTPAPGVPNGGVVGMDAGHPPATAQASSAASPAGVANGSPVAPGAQSQAGQAPSVPPASASASPPASNSASTASQKPSAALNPAASPATSPTASAKTVAPLMPPAAAVASPTSPVAPSATTPTVVAASAPSGPIPAASAGGHYVVSLGTYSSPANAQSLVASLKGAQLPAYAESVSVGGKQATRVRIGPFGQRGDAESARLKAQQVRKDMPASVTALDAAAPAADGPVASANKPAPATAKPAATAVTSKPGAPPAAIAASAKTTAAAITSSASSTTTDKPAAVSPAASGRGYAVQVSAYRTEAEALALRNKLRAAGFTAFSERVQADSGTMYRVRIGPEADRDAADKMRAELSAKMSLNGMVVGYP